MHKKASRLLAFAVFATLLVVPMWAQSPPANPLTCLSGTACKINFIPIFSSNGGPATEKASLMHVTNGFVTVGGAVTASKGGGVHNTISGTNTQPVGHKGGAGTFGLLSTSGESSTGSGWPFQGAGAWGDGGEDSNYGILGPHWSIQQESSTIMAPLTATRLYGFNHATGGTGFSWAPSMETARAAASIRAEIFHAQARKTQSFLSKAANARLRWLPSSHQETGLKTSAQPNLWAAWQRFSSIQHSNRPSTLTLSITCS